MSNIRVSNVRGNGSARIDPSYSVPSRAIGQLMVHITWSVPPGGYVEYDLESDDSELETNTDVAAFLFRHDDFEGTCLSLSAQNGDLRTSLLNDEVSSLIVARGDWVLYKDINFGQPYTTPDEELIVVRRGMYRNIDVDLGIPNDDLSSLRPVRNLPAYGAIRVVERNIQVSLT